MPYGRNILYAAFVPWAGDYMYDSSLEFLLHNYKWIPDSLGETLFTHTLKTNLLVEADKILNFLHNLRHIEEETMISLIKSFRLLNEIQD